MYITAPHEMMEESLYKCYSYYIKLNILLSVDSQFFLHNHRTDFKKKTSTRDISW